MAAAKKGDKVKVHYTGSLEDGTVFDTSAERGPYEFTIGESRIVPGFAEAVIGMKPGQSKTVEIPAKNAYGPHRKDMIAKIERSKLPAHLNPEIGQRLRIDQADGQKIPATVIKLSASTVTLDANHPLAGKDLIFDIELLEIV
ncbi:MAG: peptidylprolyl isomerase [Candidatus Zixiibacteriota bacterium]|nr:MAG: peptidylprolyl isomerase [candidate division Zixibacteria bacterium]